MKNLKTSDVTPSSTTDFQVSALVYFLIITLSLVYYLIYHGIASLHDLTHYMVAGTTMLRDNANLPYPYSSMNPEGSGDAYSFFQDNGLLIDIAKSYPSRLYSFILGGFFVATGGMQYYAPHAISALSIIGANILLYVIARKFFNRYTRIAFVMSVAFTPIIGAVIYPSNDAVGYFFSVLILWACVSPRFSPLAIGILIGTFAHLRSQTIFFIIIVPFFLAFVKDQRGRISGLVVIVLGTIAAYGSVDFLTKRLINSAVSAGGGLDFYIRHFLGSFYGFEEVGVIAVRALRNLATLGDITFLHAYFYIGVLGLVAGTDRLSKGLIWSAFAYVFFPLCIYSMDRFSDPHARYYVGAVPFLALAWFLIIKDWANYRQAHVTRRIVLMLPVLMLVSWFAIHGAPIKHIFSMETIKSRVNYLNMNDAADILSENFQEQDLVITNHSLPAGIVAGLRYIPQPSFKDFVKGDNSGISGLLFVYEDSGPGAFFRPSDWLQNGELPPVIRDEYGTEFSKAATVASKLLASKNVQEQEAKFVVYTNTDRHHRDLRNIRRERHYSNRRLKQFTVSRIHSPMFEALNVWEGSAQRDVNSLQQLGVITGPGPTSPNVLSQRFTVTAGEQLLVVATAASADKKDAVGRLQVNWLGNDSRYLGTEFLAFPTTGVARRVQKTVTAPPGAISGVVYVGPHREGDKVKYHSMNIFGKHPDYR